MEEAEVARMPLLQTKDSVFLSLKESGQFCFFDLQASFQSIRKLLCLVMIGTRVKCSHPGVLKIGDMLNLESWVKKRGDMLGADAGHLDILFYPNISKWGRGNVDFENKGTFINEILTITSYFSS